MPDLDFPDAPAVNDQWTGSNGALYEWDGSTWNLASTLPSGELWRDIAAHSTVKPVVSSRSLELDTGTALYFGDSTTPCPAVRTPNQDIFVQSAVGRTAWLQSGQSGGVLGIAPSSASLNVDLLLQGGAQLAAFKGASPAAGSLQFSANQLQLRVGGAWQTVYPDPAPGIADAPTDGQLYGRQSAVWAPISTAVIWQVVGATITPTDATKTLALAPVTNSLQWSQRAVKGRLGSMSGIDDLLISANASLSADNTTWTFDDTTKSGWLIDMRPSASAASDVCQMSHANPGAPVQWTTMLGLSNVGNLFIGGPKISCGFPALRLNSPTGGPAKIELNPTDGAGYNSSNSRWMQQFDYTGSGDDYGLWYSSPGGGSWLNVFSMGAAGSLSISSGTAIKSTGTTWSNPSDPRLKEDIAPYARGLADILHLEPITYRLKARPEGLCYGFDAAKVREVFPECVSQVRMKLDPSDEEETDGVLLFDIHPILVALVNAVKELARS